MSNQKICDRCGKPVADYDFPWLIMPYRPGDDSRYPFERMTRNLCRDCQSLLMDWLLNIDSEKKREIENKLIELVDQGAFDRVNIMTASEIKTLLKNDPLNGYIRTINENIFEEENSDGEK
jgi:hypothetical protein